MSKGIKVLGLLTALILIIPSAASAQIRQAKDPAVEEYLKAYDDKVKAEKKAKAKARRADPHRKLRPYLTLDEIYAMMAEVAAANPEMVSVSDYGRSVDGRKGNCAGKNSRRGAGIYGKNIK